MPVVRLPLLTDLGLPSISISSSLLALPLKVAFQNLFPFRDRDPCSRAKVDCSWPNLLELQMFGGCQAKYYFVAFPGDRPFGLSTLAVLTSILDPKFCSFGNGISDTAIAPKLQECFEARYSGVFCIYELCISYGIITARKISPTKAPGYLTL